MESQISTRHIKHILDAQTLCEDVLSSLIRICDLSFLAFPVHKERGSQSKARITVIEAAWHDVRKVARTL